MQDEHISPALTPAPSGRTGRRLLIALVLLLLLALAAVITAWQVPAVQRQIDGLTGTRTVAAPERLVQAAPSAPASPASAPQTAATLPAAASEAALEVRLALLESRLTQLNLQAQAASGNATRAEGLLIAYATRRTLDRGAPLGYLEDQLRLRFADAQPNAVQTVIDAGHSPVTLDLLYGQLEGLAPKLSSSARQEDTWAKVKREFAGLFIIRHEGESTVQPQDRIARAKLMLTSGKVGEAIAEIQLLPGADQAQQWIVSARRYDMAQRALDLLETTAMLDPRRLKDDKGTAVEQPSPLTAPAPEPAVQATTPAT